jgi:murein DD-endopeptidase MepM/ murein hydrolase activator NlpD
MMNLIIKQRISKRMGSLPLSKGLSFRKNKMKQRVWKKNSRGNTQKAKKRSAGKTFSSLNQLFSLDIRSFFRSIKQTIHDIKSLDRKWGYIAIGGVGLAVFIVISIVLSQHSKLISLSTALEAREETLIDSLLLEYSTPGYYGQGSGDIQIPDSSLLAIIEKSTYIVEAGDTLSEIADRHGLSDQTLISWNQIKDVRRVPIGAELVIPNIDGVIHKVAAGESLNGIADHYDVPFTKILDANDMLSDILQPGQELIIPGGKMSAYTYKLAMGTLFLYPVKRFRFTSGFGYRIDPFTGMRRMHYGVDLAAPVGTPVYASQAGRVISIGDNPKGFGKYVVIRHSNGYQTLYAHLLSYNVRVGQLVSRQQKIAAMGNSGRSTGPHLHFAIFRYGDAKNPLNFLYQ